MIVLVQDLPAFDGNSVRPRSFVRLGVLDGCVEFFYSVVFAIEFGNL